VRIRDSTRCCDARSDYDDGFKKYLPLCAIWRMGRLLKTGTSQKTCQTTLLFKAFGKKSKESASNSMILNFPAAKNDDSF
jgi:hypothetical protein